MEDPKDPWIAELIDTHVRSALIETHTALPARVESYDATTQTATIVLEIQREVVQPDGTLEAVTVAPVRNVPVLFPRAGGYAVTFPVQAGDPCLALFSERDLSAWKQSGRIAPPPRGELHDYSDAVAILGLCPTPAALSPAPSTSGLELRSDDGSLRIALSGSGVEIESDEAVEVLASGAGGITLETTSGPVTLQAVGPITITRGASELLDLLSQTLQALANESTGGGATPIDGQATYAALKVLVDAMRV